MAHLATSQTTLATVLDRIESAPDLSADRRREMASAVRTICKVLKTQPHMVAASTVTLWVLIRKALPAAFGITASRWRNCKSLLRAALALIDPAALPARSRVGLLPAWKALLEDPSAAPVLRGVARFSKWCSATGIEPTAVTQDVYERFHDDLAAHCLLRNPAETQQVAGRAWNIAVRTVPGWPAIELTIANRRRNPSLPWSDFPPSLEAEIEAYLSARAMDEIRFDETPIVFRAATIVGKRAQLRQFATAIVQSGVPPKKIASLADLVALENARAGLHVLLKRAADQRTSHIYGVAGLLLSLARHEVNATAEVIKGLETYCRNLKPKGVGMTQKNRGRLRQFDDPRQLGLFLDLPRKLMAAAQHVTVPTAAEARLAQEAVVIEILTVAPLRIANIAALEMGRTLILSKNTGYIIIGRAEVKNDKDIEVPLPASSVKMIKTYLKTFHPLLAPPGCQMLFPSRDGRHRNKVGLSAQITKRVRNECGLEFNVHVARHLAAKIHLEANPGGYGTVMLLLSHKSLKTTMDKYCGTESDAAFRRYTEMIDHQRGTSAREHGDGCLDGWARVPARHARGGMARSRPSALAGGLPTGGDTG